MSDLPDSATNEDPVEGSALAPEVVVAEAIPPRPWGGWSTLGWLIVGCGIWVVVGTTVATPFFIARLKSLNEDEINRVAEEIQTDSLVLSLSTFLSAAIVACYVSSLAWWRGWSPTEYLALDRPTASKLGWSLAAAIALVLLQDGLTYLSGRDVVPEFMYQVLETGSFPLLVLALVVGAPIGEELLFRGFAFRGLVPAFGPTATIAITSLLFGALHVQYDLIGVFTVILTGALIGAIRYATGSTTITMLVHGALNAVATIEALVLPR